MVGAGSATTSRSHRCTPRRGRCGSPTVPTRCTSSRSHGGGCGATSPRLKRAGSRPPTHTTKVLYEKRDRIAYVTLNRPEAKNAIDPETDALLWETWQDFRDDDGVDVAIVTGAGDAF